MKYLLLLAVLLACALLLYWRLRPYIAFARRVFGIVRDARRLGTHDRGTPFTVCRTEEEKLVCCATCGTWVAESRALSLRTAATRYCSAACLESAAGRGARKDAARRR